MMKLRGVLATLALAGALIGCRETEPEIEPELLLAAYAILSATPYQCAAGTAGQRSVSVSRAADQMGDILLPSPKGALASRGHGTIAATWTDAKVYYTIAADVPEPERIMNAIAQIEAATVLRFFPRGTETNYINFARTTADKICGFSSVGMVGGQQTVGLNDDCGIGTAIHEILHAVGFLHEQSRIDRDSHVIIQTDNIDSSFLFNFAKSTPAWYADYGTYDNYSIMHYGAYAFSNNGEPTITDLDGNAVRTQRACMTLGDAAAVNEMYGQ